MDVRIILVDPKSEENIGAVARVAKNFGCSDLYLVNPPELGIKAYTVASHAHDLLEACTIVESLQDAITDSALVIGTTAKPGIAENKHLRMPFLSPRALQKKVEGKNGVLALLFGREDTGLFNDELMRCDIIVCIPASPEYPVMNLSHAVAVLLYELSDVTPTHGTVELASRADRERLFMHLKTFLDEVGYREHKKAKTLLMLRRILGRAELTATEVRTLRGIISKAEWKIGGIKKPFLRKKSVTKRTRINGGYTLSTIKKWKN